VCKPKTNILWLSGVDKLEFQAETRMLLDIVAKSLYSEKEVRKYATFWGIINCKKLCWA
jgi:hypothetical protein